jgi:hypothetical protein
MQGCIHNTEHISKEYDHIPQVYVRDCIVLVLQYMYFCILNTAVFLMLLFSIWLKKHSSTKHINIKIKYYERRLKLFWNHSVVLG